MAAIHNGGVVIGAFDKNVIDHWDFAIEFPVTVILVKSPIYVLI
ncbi:hypothetical protein ACWF7H_19990 [Peribacillus butanolivorans]